MSFGCQLYKYAFHITIFNKYNCSKEEERKLQKKHQFQMIFLQGRDCKTR